MDFSAIRHDGRNNNNSNNKMLFLRHHNMESNSRALTLEMNQKEQEMVHQKK